MVFTIIDNRGAIGSCMVYADIGANCAAHTTCRGGL